MTRYRFRRGSMELEIEYSGDVPDAEQESISSILTYFKTVLTGAGREADALDEDRSPEKKSRRGGARKAFVSPGIDDLIKTKWLIGKTTQEIVTKLKADGIVGANEDNVNSALLRKVQSRVLTRTEQDGEWMWTLPTIK